MSLTDVHDDDNRPCGSRSDSLGIWKNEDRRTKRAKSIKIRPSAMMPASDQSWAAGAACTDLAIIQPRNPEDPRESLPRSRKSQTLPNTRRR
jgi:hypothetical protein